MTFSSSIEVPVVVEDRGPASLVGSKGHTGATLRLTFSADPDGRTFIARQFASYPFHVCRALYLDPDQVGLASVYLQSSSGGIYEHENLDLEICVTASAQAHVTTQASTIVHEMKNGEARQTVLLVAEENSLLEYLPDPLILFPHAKLKSEITVRLGEGATVILGDAFLAHDPGHIGAFFSYLESDLRITDLMDRTLAIDRFRVAGEEAMASRAGIMGQQTQHATLAVLTRALPVEELIMAMRQELNDWEGGYAGVSSLPNGCGAWARILASDGVALRDAMAKLWSAARLRLTGDRPMVRRK